MQGKNIVFLVDALAQDGLRLFTLAFVGLYGWQYSVSQLSWTKGHLHLNE